MHRHALPRALWQGFAEQLNFKQDALMLFGDVSRGFQPVIHPAHGILATFRHRPFQNRLCQIL